MKRINKYYFSLLLIFLTVSSSMTGQARIFTKKTRTLNDDSVRIDEKQKKEKRTFFSARRKRNKTMPNTLTKVRSFQESMTASEKEDMKYVLSSCANMSTLSLAMAQSDIKAALFRIQEVHPLALLEEIFKNSLLTQEFLKIKSRGWIWTTLNTKLKEALALVAERGLLSKDVVGTFSKNLNLEEEAMVSLLENKKWDDFLNILIKE